jgi:hypothetical protein
MSTARRITGAHSRNGAPRVAPPRNAPCDQDRRWREVYALPPRGPALKPPSRRAPIDGWIVQSLHTGHAARPCAEQTGRAGGGSTPSSRRDRRRSSTSLSFASRASCARSAAVRPATPLGGPSTESDTVCLSSRLLPRTGAPPTPTPRPARTRPRARRRVPPHPRTPRLHGAYTRGGVSDRREARLASGPQRVPSAASQDASVPWRSQSHSPAASDAVVST